MRVECGLFAVMGHKLLIHFFGTLAFQNGLKYRNSDLSRLIGDNFFYNI